MFEFTSWRDAGHPFAHHPFMDRVNSEEITPCMLFNAKEVCSGAVATSADSHQPSSRLRFSSVSRQKDRFLDFGPIIGCLWMFLCSVVVIARSET